MDRDSFAIGGMMDETPKRIPNYKGFGSRDPFIFLHEDIISQIIPGLFLGGHPVAHKDLTSRGIDHVVQVNYEAPNYSAPDLKGHYFKPLPNELHDYWKNDYVEDILQAIHNFKSQGSVLVHCMFGRDRSANIVYLYLLCIGHTPDEAHKQIKKNRLIASIPNYNILPLKHLEVLVPKLNQQWFPEEENK